MSKYVYKDGDYKIMNNIQKATFETSLINYNVDANVETSKGKDIIKYIFDIATGKKGNMKLKFDNVADLYTNIYTILLALDVLLIMLFCVLLVFSYIQYILFMNPIQKVYITILFNALIFVIGMFCLVMLFTRLKDSVQINIEKIVYKL